MLWSKNLARAVASFLHCVWQTSQSGRVTSWDSESKTIPGFKFVHVFDVSQTDGEPLLIAMCNNARRMRGLHED